MINYWEEFDGTPFVPGHKRPHITLKSRGLFYFNQFAYQMMGEPKAIVFLFNRAESVIGVTSAGAGRKNAFPIRPSAQGWSIAATPFLRRYGIKLEPKSNLIFQDPYTDNEGILRLDLRKVVEAPKRIHKKRAKRGSAAT